MIPEDIPTGVLERVLTVKFKETELAAQKPSSSRIEHRMVPMGKDKQPRAFLVEFRKIIKKRGGANE